MEDVRVGSMVRAVRLKRGLRQIDLAARAGVSRQLISRVEAGGFGPIDITTLRRISDALSMPPLVTLGWRGAEVAQLLDEAHAALVDRLVAILAVAGWECVIEYSFAHYGERGSVDILAWRAANCALLIVEVKTRIVDLQDLFSSLDRKRRLVPVLVAHERSWKPAHLGVVLAVPATSTMRNAIAGHAATFAASLPARTVAVRHWVGAPESDLRGIWFLQDSRPA